MTPQNIPEMAPDQIIDQSGWRLFLAAVASFPLVEGILRIRIGAAWEVSTLLSLLLLTRILVKPSLFYPTARWMNIFFVGLVIVLVSDIIGYLTYTHNLILNDLFVSQVQSIEARMFVETVRFLASVGMFSLVMIYVNSRSRVLTVLRVFICGALVEACYALYEIIIKLTGLVGTLPLLRWTDNNVLTIPRAFGTFYEPSQLGQFLTVTFFIFLLYLLLLNHKEIYSDSLYRWRYLIIFLLLTAVVASISRAAILILIVILTLSIVLRLKPIIIYSIRKPIKLLICILILIGIYTTIITYLGDDYFKNWWYLISEADADVTNSGLQRTHMISDYVVLVLKSLFTTPLGMGQGALLFTQSMVPFSFRLPCELGLPATFLYGILNIFVLHRCLQFGHNWWAALMVLLSLLMVQGNYNTTNHPWLWFVLALIPAISYSNQNNLNVTDET